MKQDTLYKQPKPLVDFTFDDAVADVFPDMIRRSVPGYDAIIAQLGVVARQHAQDDTRIYDLGCSLGAATLAMHRQTADLHVAHVCVDNSEAMVRRCRSRLERHMPQADLTVRCDDLLQIEIVKASVVVINFTLQFIPPEARQQLINTIFHGLIPGGVLILSEKLVFDDEQENNQQIEWHHAFKRANGYTDLEICQKRAAIENILIPESRQQHEQRLLTAGFKPVYQWFQNFNFASFVALKAANK